MHHLLISPAYLMHTFGMLILVIFASHVLSFIIAWNENIFDADVMQLESSQM
jgi:hypothetical protein